VGVIDIFAIVLEKNFDDGEYLSPFSPHLPNTYRNIFTMAKLYSRHFRHGENRKLFDDGTPPPRLELVLDCNLIVITILLFHFK
jgi:hypothetical protein